MAVLFQKSRVSSNCSVMELSAEEKQLGGIPTEDNYSHLCEAPSVSVIGHCLPNVAWHFLEGQVAEKLLSAPRH